MHVPGGRGWREWRCPLHGIAGAVCSVEKFSGEKLWISVCCCSTRCVGSHIRGVESRLNSSNLPSVRKQFPNPYCIVAFVCVIACARCCTNTEWSSLASDLVPCTSESRYVPECSARWPWLSCSVENQWENKITNVVNVRAKITILIHPSK